MAEVVSYPPRIELFARVRAPGWEAWGLEAPPNEEEKELAGGA